MAPPVSKRILVIEDESLIADAVAARLRSEGYAVTVADDGPSGGRIRAEQAEPLGCRMVVELPGGSLTTGTNA